MKVFITKLASLLILFSVFESAYGQCDNCPSPNVSIFGVEMDVNMPPPDPSTGDYSTPASNSALSNWLSLENAVFALDSISITDPEAGCVNWSFASALGAADTAIDSVSMLSFEQDWQSEVPPSGTITADDYLIWAIVDSSGGQYRFRAFLEDGISRARIDSVQQYFTSAAGAQHAADSAVARLEPVFDKIRAYQMSLRSNGTNVALDAHISVVPSQTSMHATQTISVTFRVTDCDGTPLRGITLSIGATNGTFDQSSIVTDANGNATANFTANNVVGVADLDAACSYTTPMHKQESSNSDALVNIDDPGLSILDFDIAVSQKSETRSIYDSTGIAYQTFEFDLKKANATLSLHQYVLATITDSSVSIGNILGGSGAFRSYASEKYITDGGPNNLLSIYRFTNTRISAPQTFTDNFTLAAYEIPPATKPTWSFSANIGATGVQTVLEYTNSNGSVYQSNGDIPQSGQVYYPTPQGHPISSFGGDSLEWDFTQTYKYDSLDVNGASRNEIIESAQVSVAITAYEIPTAVRSTADNVPKTFLLYQNYPNPFNPSTMISYNLPVASNVNLTVYDILGRQVETLVNQRQTAGRYGVKFDASKVSSGVYFYRLSAGNFVTTKKMAVLK